jgi:nitroreductase/NAD-dependent dihydropyrimidine dehydrogenase PreA subunit
MLYFTVSEELCTRCGECALDCVMGIIEQDGDRLPRIRPENEGSCLRCQHCLAVCPTGAISIHGRDPAGSDVLDPNGIPSLESMLRLVRGRRSVRRYQNENVDPALIRRLLQALANVPTGSNRQELTFTVIADGESMRRLQEQARSSLAAGAATQLPQGDWFRDNIVPIFLDKGPDIIFRTAPHALFVSAPLAEIGAPVDVVLALAYFEMLAHTAGLGTVWCGLLKALLEMAPELKERVGLPADHFYYPMLFGLPAVRYHRTVQRDDGAVIRFATAPAPTPASPAGWPPPPRVHTGWGGTGRPATA